MIPLKDDVPVERPPLLTIGIIAANITAFLWQVSAVGLAESALRAGAIPYEILTLQDVGPPDIVPPPFTILTSMFLHGGLAHIAGNMLFLWVFGKSVEDALGRARFLVLYFGSGIVAALAQTAASAATGDLFVPMVGASGAISGILAANLLLFPRARVLTLVPIFFFIRLIYVPAYFFIGIWFGLQLLSAAFGSAGSGVAFFAHIGGFLCGLLLTKLLGRPARWRRRPIW